jgi:protein SCO1/2
MGPPGNENVGVDEHLERRIPLDLVFRDHTGRRVTLGALIDGERPVLVNLVYHSCPTFCSLVLDGTTTALIQQPWTAGMEMTVLTISIDPRDTPEVAADRRRRVLHRYGRDAGERGWHFLVAEQSMTDDELLRAYGANPAAERLAEALGFRYQWMPRQLQYAHPGVIMLLTPDGRIARYLYGLEYDVNDLRLGLLEASEGRSISTVERALLYCYRYDASQQTYVVMAWRIMKIGGGLTALLIAGVLAFFWRREIGRRRPHTPPGSLDAEAPPSELKARS